MTLRSEAAPPAHASELPAVCALIRGGARLVTLTGLGHAGKSRLARATSRALAQEGLSWSLCDASSLSGVSELREALAAAAGASSRAPHLLVLDDLERLGGLDDDRRAHALVTCLTAAPALRLLVTSRAALGRPEEIVVPVAADLPVPVDVIEQDAAVGWSWERLSPRARGELGRLSVIAGPFGFGLAVALSQDDGAQVLETLEALTRVSLLDVAPGAPDERFRVPEAVRAFVHRACPPEHLAAWRDELAATVLAHLPRRDALSLLTPRALHLTAVERERLAQIAAAPATDSRPIVLTQALRAATELVMLPGDRPLRGAHVEQLTALLDRDDLAAVAADVRIAAAMSAVLAGVAAGDGAHVDRALARCVAWGEAAGDDRQPVIVRHLTGLLMQRRCDYARLHPMSRALVDACDGGSEPRLFRSAVELYVWSGRALGLADAEAVDALMVEATQRLMAAAHHHDALAARTSRALLALQLDRPLLALTIAAEAERDAVAGGHGPIAALARRVRALGECERGRRAIALGLFDEALGSVPEEAWTETVLDRAATALEAGRYDEARRDLDRAAPRLGSAFERAYHHALTQALAALACGTPSQREPHVIGGVDGAACRILATLTSGAKDEVGLEARHSSFRVRLALRLATSIAGRGFSAPSIVAPPAVAGATSLCVRGRWVDLKTRPLLARLVTALVQARLDGAPRVDRATCGAVAWPGESMRDASRDRRLESAMSRLRAEGLDIIGSQAGYQIDPGQPVVRLSTTLWPCRASDAPTRRPRGRPRRDPTA